MFGFEDPVVATDDSSVGDTDGSDRVCLIHGIDLCPYVPGPPLIAPAGTTTIDTSDAASCSAMIAGSPEVCVVYADSISVEVGGVLRGIGSRALVLASNSGILVAGTIDVSSERIGLTGAAANDTTCVVVVGEDAAAGAGGGAGASFQGNGGDGGDGGNGQGGPSQQGGAEPLIPRGGCLGGNGGRGAGLDGGVGGSSGGSVWLLASGTIDVSGQVRANGAGGTPSSDKAGGGAGGSGGFIVLAGAELVGTGGCYSNGGAGASGAAAGAPGLGYPAEMASRARCLRPAERLWRARDAVAMVERHRATANRLVAAAMAVAVVVAPPVGSCST